MLSSRIAEKRIGRVPCYKCEERTSECHASCEKYIKWSEAFKRDKEANMKANMSINEADVLQILKYKRARQKHYDYLKRK